MEDNETIAKSKATNLKIKVSYTDKHITKGTVLVCDAFNKVGTFDYWSTSTLIFEEMKKIKKDDKIVCIASLLDFTIGEVYRIHTVDEDRKSFMVIDNIEENNIIDFENFESYFKLVKQKKDPIVKQVTDKFKQRSKVGIEKYGTTLADNKLSLDEWLNHAIEEQMDNILYLTKLREELKKKGIK